MIYQTAADWRAAKQKRVLLFGMSGLGKTHISNMLRASGQWFHYSVDYRIGTRYMGEHITDNFKREAMKVPFLRALLRTDSIHIGSNITFNNLAPLSTYLGKPGDPAKGGLPFEEYMRRQDEHREAELRALKDTPRFIERGRDLYDYPNFICDTGGSICEVVDPNNPADPILSLLSQHTLMVWIEGSEAHTEELIRRFVAAPKPMYYAPDLLRFYWAEYLRERGVAETDVDPDDFMAATYGRALAHRQPLYRDMARNWGLAVPAEDMARVASPAEFDALIEASLAARA
ncbi:MAG: ATPase [Rhodobacterales bacterium]|nr:MAG: ATPase [Rhodobacterales bacterium]